jgi:tRNA pseudouridine55 synthase
MSTAVEPSGVLIVNKPVGMTSHDVVNIVRRLYNTRRVGHAGTLDPLAEGVLVVLVGRAAKATEYISHSSKKYRATLRLGLTTDTEDITGEILTESTDVPSAETVIKTAAEFCGRIMQTPPMYSALKVGGQKLVDLARRGVTIEREAREVTVFDISCTPTDSDTDYVLDVHCSGGTYIRTLCADIGAKLSCGGVMATLARTEACGFDISRAHTIEALREYDKEALVSLLIPTEELFSDCESVRLPDFYEKLSRSGCEIYQKKLGTSLPVRTRVRMYGKASESNKSGFYALGEVIEGEKCKTPELGSAIKSIKIFDLG